MKRSLSFAINPIANGLIFSTFSDYGAQEQFYCANLAELLELLPDAIGEAVATQEEAEANEADQARAMNRKLGYPVIGESYVQSVQRKQEDLNRAWRGMLDEPAMSVGAPQVFDDGPTAA